MVSGFSITIFFFAHFHCFSPIISGCMISASLMKVFVHCFLSRSIHLSFQGCLDLCAVSLFNYLKSRLVFGDFVGCLDLFLVILICLMLCM